MRQKSQSTTVLQYLKAVEVPEQRGLHKCCILCLKDFSIMLKEHQCKRCKRAVCAYCSPNKAQSPRFDKDPKKLHRQCNFCKDESQQLRKFVKDNRLAFAVDTLSKDWLLNFQLSVEDSQQDFTKARSETDKVKNSGLDQFRAQKLKVFEEFSTSQNYSMLDFFDLVYGDNHMSVIIFSTEEVLNIFLKKFPKVGYQHDLVILTVFLLCFSSVSTTYTLLTLIFSYIIPTDLYNPSGQISSYDFNYEMSTITQINNMINRRIAPKFLQSQLFRYIQTLTINFFLFETTFLIFSEIFSDSKDGFQKLIKCLALALNMSDDEGQVLISKDNNYIELYLLRNTRASKISTQLMLTKNLNIQKSEASNNKLKKAVVTLNATIAEEKKKQLEDSTNKANSEKRYAEDLIERQRVELNQVTGTLQKEKAERIELANEIDLLQKQLSEESFEKNKLQEELILIKHQIAHSKSGGQIENRDSYSKQDMLILNQNLQNAQENINSLQIKNNQQSLDLKISRYEVQQMKTELTELNTLLTEELLKSNNLRDLNDQNNLMIQKLIQALELNNNVQDDQSMGYILVRKNEEINTLTEKLITQQKTNEQMEKQINEIMQSRDSYQMEVGRLNSQFESNKAKDLEYCKMLTQQEQFQSQVRQKEQAMKELLDNQKQQINLIQQKNKEIDDQKSKLALQITQIQSQGQELQALQKQLEDIKADVDLNKYVVSILGQQQLEQDKQVDQDIEYISQDLDSIKRRLLSSLREMIQNAQSQARFTKMSAQAYQQELEKAKGNLQNCEDDQKATKEELTTLREMLIKQQSQKLENSLSHKQDSLTSRRSQDIIQDFNDQEPACNPNCQLF